MNLPAAVALNAWTGAEAAAGGLLPDAARWGSRTGLPHSQQPLPLGEPVRLEEWWNPEVGYGIVLPDRDDPHLTDADKAAAIDAPAPVRALLAARPGTPILRWSRTLPARNLRRYFPDRPFQDPVIGLTKPGTAPNRLPRYLLIVGGPEEIPWSVQYALNTRHAVGRLPLAGDELGAYIDALLSGWAGTEVDVTAPVVWAVDHGGGDITTLMRTALAEPLARRLDDPRLPGLRYLAEQAATGEALLAALRTRPPALLVTSSHGYTSLDGPASMRGTLGLPVDQAHTPVLLDGLAAAIPAGAVWYAQACCSAGSDAPSHYTGLVGEGTSAHRVLTAVAELGATVAPAVARLLGRPGPVRGVIGHIEPTFDWTLRVQPSGPTLGHDIVTGLSDNLHSGQPIGLAFTAYRDGIGELHTQWADGRERLDAGDLTQRPLLTELRLTAIDRQSLVLLGDPTVTLPRL